jgi:hypothetical protein
MATSGSITLGEVAAHTAVLTVACTSVLPHPGMLPNGLGIASPECSRRGVTLSIGIQRVLPEIWHMLAAA